MKINFTQLATLLFTFLVSIYLMFLISCSAKFHQKKFIQKGGKVNCDSDTLWKYDTTFVDGKMQIDSFPIPCNCPELELPKTVRELRIELRYDLKRQKERDAFVIDSMNKVKQIAKVEGKNKTKQTQSDNKLKGKEVRVNKKSGVWYNLRFIAIIAGLLLLIFIFFRINKIFK